MYEDVPDFETFLEIADDIIENKDTDYKDLKVIIYDTIDEFFSLVEPYVVKMYNKGVKADKRVETINGAYGGFSRGEQKAISLILDKVWELKEVGVKMFIIGHTKTRTKVDPITGEDYDVLTNKLMNTYFDAIRTKLHFLGVASIDRTIETHTVKKRMGKDEEKGKIKEERRVITFRDDNFNVDSKSRFAEIVEQIPLSADEFIKAIEDAIKVEHAKEKSGKSIEETKVEQAKQEEESVSKKIEQKKEDKEFEVNVDRNLELITDIMKLYSDEGVSTETKKEFTEYLTSNGYSLKKPESVPTKAFEKALEILSK